MKNKLAGASLTAIGLALAANGAFAAPEIAVVPTADTALQMACKEEIPRVRDDLAFAEKEKAREESEWDSLRERRIALIQKNAPRAADRLVDVFDQRERLRDELKKAELEQVVDKYVAETEKLMEKNVPDYLAPSAIDVLSIYYENIVAIIIRDSLRRTGLAVGALDKTFGIVSDKNNTKIEVNWDLRYGEKKGFSLDYELLDSGFSQHDGGGDVSLRVEKQALLSDTFRVWITGAISNSAVEIDEKGIYRLAEINSDDSSGVKKDKLTDFFIRAATHELDHGDHFGVREGRGVVAEVEAFCARFPSP